MAETPPFGGFLPPEASGPEPELGAAPAHTPSEASAQPPPSGYGPPTHAQTGPAAGAQPAQAPQWTTAAASGPDNNAAVLGFCLSISSVALLLVSAGLSTLVSLGLAIPGMLQSRKGTRLISEGKTAKNGSLASAGFVIGIVALVLSVLATIFWILIAVLIATDDDARREFERELDEYERRSSVTAVLVVARILGAALS